ncbi:AI-2E family transporter [Marinospirillum alkaliphilum]|uniref:Predicted PurR-regulated permease PerM n=1 Tax=Marinospirillum alkaliphilum DSM 21637 TaxID=1122209 RepID=A0A1K1WTG5_9GAMM|nr:AI-2E family transporter [Marinospirillum alkaliphilum]SFX40551.1 Predicted PurR-regulated permease PerM [Marinospirillum alkaliphilum DSM 21637]
MSQAFKFRSSGLTWLVGIAALVVILAGLKAAETIVIPIMLALFIGIICTPPLHFMTRHKVPPVAAILIIVAFLVVFGGLLGLVVGSAIDSFINRLPDYQRRLEAEMVSLLPLLERVGMPVTRDQLLEHLNPSQAMDWVGKALSNLGSLLTNLFLILFIVVFLLLEEATFGQKLRQAVPSVEKQLRHASDFVRQVNKYLVIKSTISLITGVLITLWVWWLGLDFPVLWGLIALLMNFIPNVGSILAAIPAVLLAVVQLGIPDALLVASGYLAVNVVMGNLVEPRFMGKGLGLSPLVVFLSLILWGWLFGAVGMFLSIPLTMIVKIALEQAPSTQWLAVMLGNGLEQPVEKEE